MKFPKQVIDCNDLNKFPDDFFNLSIPDAMQKFCLREPKPKTIADLIFWLNMAASAFDSLERKP